MATKASGLRISNKVLFFGVTFLFGSFLLVCCKKNDPWDQAFRNGWSELDSIADRSFFPTGISRWIYEDSVTKQLDTVTLVELRADTIEVYYLEPPILYYTKVDKRIVLFSSRFQKTLSYYTDLKSPFTSDYAVIRKNGYFFAFAPLERKLKFETLHGLSGVVEFYPAYTSNGLTYINVSEVEHLGESLFMGEHTRYFLAPNVGIFKFINHSNNQVWQLKDVY
jgi:hypothetical protein